ncbi:hypothetical protein AXG93_673s1430 [Marchantia polymorpha subsp. ruderalis]|uniref:Uncharacterized protein n=1 Tax=Marchantia polymorpha subsp. ruderalis TaxID=1480154 RepID=A0A176WL61_MARPO|nr:hypothetical protein AXG93_673s1430 [Marchantia polymorpha subsp. ruderalis]
MKARPVEKRHGLEALELDDNCSTIPPSSHVLFPKRSQCARHGGARDGVRVRGRRRGKKRRPRSNRSSEDHHHHLLGTAAGPERPFVRDHDRVQLATRPSWERRADPEARTLRPYDLATFRTRREKPRAGSRSEESRCSLRGSEQLRPPEESVPIVAAEPDLGPNGEPLIARRGDPRRPVDQRALLQVNRGMSDPH